MNMSIYENLVLKIYRKAQCMRRVMLCFEICMDKSSSIVIVQNSVFGVASVYDEYVENMLKSSSNLQVEFKGNMKYLLKNLYYVMKLPCLLYWENLMQYNATFVRWFG